jgi:hypothetical protein
MNAINAVTTPKTVNTVFSEKSPTKIRKVDVNALRDIVSVFNKSICANGDYILAIDQMIAANRNKIIGLAYFNLHLLKTFNVTFIARESARKRSIDLIHVIFIEHIHPDLDKNDQELALAIIEKMVIPTSSWAR